MSRAKGRAARGEVVGDGGGDHPPLETLLAYTERRLPSERAEEIREHLSLCSACTDELRDLAAFVDSIGEETAETATGVRDEAWQRLRATLPSARRPASPPSARGRSGIWLGLAAAVLAAAVGLAVWGFLAGRQARDDLAAQRLANEHLTSEIAATHEQLRRKQGEVTALLDQVERLREDPSRDPAGSSPAVGVVLRPLFRVRNTAPPDLFRPTAGPAEVVARSQDGRVVLDLDLSELSASESLGFRLEGATGRTLWQDERSFSGLQGDLGTRLSIDGLRPGLYVLHVSGGTESLALAFRLTRK